MTEPPAQDRVQPVTPAGRDALDALRVAAITLLVGYHVACLRDASTSGALAGLLSRVFGAGWA
ncbi:MAG TPA: hypothetical protein VF331_15785 [Polyangiales bacterium]